MTRTVLTAALAFLALAAPASAATLSLDGTTLVFTAAPGEANRLYLGDSWNPEGKLRLEDANGFTSVPAGCVLREETVADCDVPSALRAELGDGDDSAGFSETWVLGIGVEILGGDGDDALDGAQTVARSETLDGGPGRDVIDGFGGDDVLRGGAGDDDLDGNGGADQVLGEDGDDLLAGDDQAAPGADLIDGGAGVDEVRDYVEYGTDIHPPADVSLDGQANDGRAGEGDNVVGVERFRAYVSGRFVLTDGDEDWQVWSNMNSGDSEVLAGGGNDRIVGEDARETIDGGAGDDYLEGGKNHDTITGGPGRDTIFGDDTDASCNADFPESCVLYGNDAIDARDGEVDQVDCGAGQDVVSADPADVVAANCEVVTRGGVAGAPASAKATVARASLRKALARGLKVRLAGAQPGKLALRLRLGAKTVGRGMAKVAADGTATARVRFTKAARKRLRTKRAVTLKLVAGGASTTVKLRR